MSSKSLFDKLGALPIALILEILGVIVIINLIFSLIYYKIYINDNKHFNNIYNPTKPLTLNDFFFFSNTIFYSIGYDIIPQSNLAKGLCIIQLKLAYVISAIIIVEIVE